MTTTSRSKPRRYRLKPPAPTEHAEQSALMAWARIAERAYPGLDLLHAVPNGGWRHPGTAVKLKREGVKAGVPDLDLPVARGPWHGLRIEMKAKGGTVSDEQSAWLLRLESEGYRTAVCYGWEAARDIIIEYLTEARA